MNGFELGSSETIRFERGGSITITFSGYVRPTHAEMQHVLEQLVRPHGNPEVLRDAYKAIAPVHRCKPIDNGKHAPVPPRELTEFERERDAWARTVLSMHPRPGTMLRFRNVNYRVTTDHKLESCTAPFWCTCRACGGGAFGDM